MSQFKGYVFDCQDREKVITLSIDNCISFKATLKFIILYRDSIIILNYELKITFLFNNTKHTDF